MRKKWLTALSLLLVRKACIVSLLLVSLLLATSCAPQPRSLEELTPYFSSQYSLGISAARWRICGTRCLRFCRQNTEKSQTDLYHHPIYCV